MSSFGDFSAALEARETLTALIRQTVGEMNPPYRYGQVVSWDRYARTCYVQFPEGGDPMPVNMGAIQPVAVGQIVRIGGNLGDKFLDDVIGDSVVIGNEVEMGAGSTLATNQTGMTLNAYAKVNFDGVMYPPGTNNWDLTNHQFVVPVDGVYVGSGTLRCFNNSYTGTVDWATTLFVNGSAFLRLDEKNNAYTAGAPVQLRLDFQMGFLQGDVLDYRFYNGLGSATLQQASSGGENFSYFRIDLMRLLVL